MPLLRCPSDKSNDGVSGDSLTEALEALELIRDNDDWTGGDE